MNFKINFIYLFRYKVITFKGYVMASDLSTDMATIVNIEACAIVCSSHGIILHI